jgi:hypothetical protein
VTDPNKPAYNEFSKLSPNSQSRGGTNVDLWLIHTQEGGGGNSAAEDLADFLDNPANQVSYHYTISQASDGGVTVVDVVDTSLAAWSVLSANDRSINLCFAGSRAGWTRDEWLQQSKAIDVAAYLAVQDCKKYGIPTKVLAPPYNSNPPGISDHKYVTQWLKDGTHTDVGNNFPWDVFTVAVNKYATGAVTPTPPSPAPGGFDMLTAQQQQDMYNWSMWTYAQLQGFNPKMVQLSLPGCAPDGKNLTAIDALADIKDGITLPKAP